METPTAKQLETAMEVLTRLGERLDRDTAHSMVQFPDTELGICYKASLQVQSIQQVKRIEAVSSQLKNWRDELSGQLAYVDFAAPDPARPAHSRTSGGNLWFWAKNLLAAKSPRRQMG
jgi:hypothetical protein